MNYTAKHAQALKKVERDGVAVEFKRSTPGVYNPETDTHSPPTEQSVLGFAVELPGDPEEYAELELIPLEPVTLLFVPEVMGETPMQNGQVYWAGKTRTVKQIFPYRPAGVLLAARVIVV